MLIVFKFVLGFIYLFTKKNIIYSNHLEAKVLIIIYKYIFTYYSKPECNFSENKYFLFFVTQL